MSEAVAVDELAELLKKHSVNRAVIIDDAFDMTFVDAVDDSKLQAFTTTVKGSKAVLDELTALKIDIEGVAKGDEVALTKLAGERANYREAMPAVEALLITYFEQRDPLADLTRHLDHLKIPVVPLGVSESLPEKLEADIAFIDYYLEQEPPPNQNPEDNTDYGKKAREKAQAIYKTTRAHIVLMSNRSGVKQLEEEFRKRAKLLKGYFRFVSKDDLSRVDVLRELLSVLPLAAGFGTNYTIS